ncbi:Rhodanese-like domain-containing protein, partial [Catenaria anguillulae PL171]
KDVLLIDVRNPDEHAATGLIPTAVPLPLPELQAALQEPNMQFQLLNGFPKPSREATNLVMYCKAGVRADMAAQVARALGFKRVRSYKGSWIEW